MVQLVIGGLDSETAFVELDVDCNADLILIYDWLRSHYLIHHYSSNEVCLCTDRGCTSGRRVRLDLTLDVPTPPTTRPLRLSPAPAEARAFLGAVGLGEVPTFDRP